MEALVSPFAHLRPWRGAEAAGGSACLRLRGCCRPFAFSGGTGCHLSRWGPSGPVNLGRVLGDVA